MVLNVLRSFNTKGGGGFFAYAVGFIVEEFHCMT